MAQYVEFLVPRWTPPDPYNIISWSYKCRPQMEAYHERMSKMFAQLYRKPTTTPKIYVVHSHIVRIAFIFLVGYRIWLCYCDEIDFYDQSDSNHVSAVEKVLPNYCRFYSHRLPIFVQRAIQTVCWAIYVYIEYQTLKEKQIIALISKDCAAIRLIYHHGEA